MVKAKSKSTIVGFIDTMSDGMMRAGRNTYLFGLGAVAMCEEQARELFDRMISKGESFETSDENVLGQAAGKAKELGRQVETKVQDTVSWTLNRAGVPSRDEIGTLISRVEDLTTKVEQLRVSH